MAERLADGLEDAGPRDGGGVDWLVTGATGFLGRRLVPELLARTDARVHCVVRAACDADARSRLGPVAADPRVVAHAGDVSVPGMGLDSARWRALARSVGHVVHAAASTSLALPFDAHAIANLHGAREVARFVRAGATKTLHHVSSLAVLASTDLAVARLDEAVVLAPDTRVFGPYAQSKHAAESLLRRAVPDVRILRPGLLTGDSSTGAAAAACPLRAFLRAVAATGCVALPDEDLRVDVTPIDHAARALADLVTAQHERLGGRECRRATCAPADRPVVHVASERGASLGDLVRALRRRYVVDVVAPAELLRRARARLSRDGALALVASAYRLLGADAQRDADLFLHTGRVFPGDALASITGRAAPPIDDALLDRYVACVEVPA
jgi:thioester reductase-like protein